jgi:uncharacterized phiE125 gp8 family phage protein
MAIVVYTDPATEPITLAEAKLNCRVDHNDENDLLNMLIAAARQHAETILHRAIITQTLDAYFDEFPSEFALPPMQSVTAITYVDLDGATQTLAANQYTVDAVSQPSRITPAYAVTWPATRNQTNAVKVRFLAGYGAASAVPQCIKNWMLFRICTLYNQRDQFAPGAFMAQIPEHFVDSLLDFEVVRGRT